MLGVFLYNYLHTLREFLRKKKRHDSPVPQFLNLIFNRSLFHGEIPVDWKSAIVVPIFKNGLKGDKNNYRSVSLTSIVGSYWKVFSGTQKFLDENKLIYSSQYGFNKAKSYLTSNQFD